jgi:hypothetical protein
MFAIPLPESARAPAKRHAAARRGVGPAQFRAVRAMKLLQAESFRHALACIAAMPVNAAMFRMRPGVQTPGAGFHRTRNYRHLASLIDATEAMKG